jgi:hypothetical protein
MVADFVLCRPITSQKVLHSVTYSSTSHTIILSVFRLQSADTHTGSDIDNSGAISLKTAALGIPTSPVRQRVIFAVLFSYILWVRT